GRSLPSSAGWFWLVGPATWRSGWAVGWTAYSGSSASRLGHSVRWWPYRSSGADGAQSEGDDTQGNPTTIACEAQAASTSPVVTILTCRPKRPSWTDRLCLHPTGGWD